VAVKISDLTAVTEVAGGTELEVNEAGTSKKVSVTQLDNYLAAATQTFTNKTTTGHKETRVAVSASEIDLADGNYFTKTITGATTFTVANVAASGTANALILDLTDGGSETITWWAGVTWAAGAAPVLTAAGRDVLGFFSHDGGTTWTGLVLGIDVK
jgi:hypothetical protein